MVEKLLNLVGFLGHWTYLVVFLAAFLESSAFMGLLVPGESVVVVAGFLAFQGTLDLGKCLWAVMLGAVLGDSAGFGLGNALGRRYFEKHRRLLLLKEKHVRIVDGYFDRHGGKTVFFGRFIGLLRAMAPFVAGMSRMPYRRFAPYNIAGCLLWSLAFTLLGYFFGQSWQIVEKWSGRAGAFLLFLLLVAAGFAWLYRTIVRKQAAIFEWFQDRHARLAASRRVQAFADRHPEMITFVKERLSSRSYLGLHLTVGLLASAACMWVFGSITEDILTGDPLATVDQWVLGRVLYFRTPFVTAFMKSAMIFGSAMTIAIASILVVGLFLLRRRTDQAIGYAVAITGGSALIVVLQAMIRRPRPGAQAALVHAAGFGFPSGNTMISVLFYGILAYFLVVELRSWRLQVLTGIAATSLVSLVGLSGIYFQIQYLSDVAAGLAGGLFWLTVCVTGLEVHRRARRSSGPEGTRTA